MMKVVLLPVHFLVLDVAVSGVDLLSVRLFPDNAVLAVGTESGVVDFIHAICH